MERDKSKGMSGKEQRESYRRSTLRNIRARRLSYDATNKGLFPERTPSRMLSPTGSLQKDDNFRDGTDRPALSLTKLDFELLRDWDWKERQKRLETWGQDLGITKVHRPFNKHHETMSSSIQEGDKGVQKRQQHRQSRLSDKEGRSQPVANKAILQRELERLTGLKVYEPGDTAARKSLRTSVSIRRHSDAGVTPSLRQSMKNPFADDDDHHHHSHHHHHRPHQNEHQQNQTRNSSLQSAEKVQRVRLQILDTHRRQLDNIKKQASEALQSKKKTFGKMWSRKLSVVSPRKPSMVISSHPYNQSRKSKKQSIHHRDKASSESALPTTIGSGSDGSYGTESYRTPPTVSRSMRHSHGRHSRTDMEEEQPSTSYTSHGHSSRKSTRTHTRRSSSSSRSTPSDSAPAIAVNDLFRGIRKSLDEENKEVDNNDGENSTTTQEKNEPGGGKYRRPEQPVEYQDACFGGIRFVDRSAIKPMTKVNKGYEFDMAFDDKELGLGMGRTQHLKVKFFKNTATHEGRSKKMLDKMAVEKAKKQQEKEEAQKEKNEKKATTTEEGASAPSHPTTVVKTWTDLTQTSLIDFPSTSGGKSRAERLREFEKALMELPGISSRWRVEVSATSGRTSFQDVNAVNRIPKRAQFTRPPRRIWYTPLPLTIKKYYRTNWKKIRFDVRKLMKGKEFWPKLWINFEESHPKKLYELIRAKLAVNDFDKYGFKRIFDWGRGIHPDYIDWILEDIVPHPGRYYYARNKNSNEQQELEAVRRASVEEADFRLKEWFVKPPRYIPNTPLSPPFDQYDFCGYGNREKPFFLAFTLPREILHYYAPPSNIQKFFRNIPKPPYAFPGYTFKRWLNYPLEQKLPQYYPFPKRFMTWTRGKVGESLQCNSKTFYNEDPFIQKRTIVYSPYHDSHARKYILRKDVLDRIWELGIINSKGEVKCSMKEFNRNRQILRDYEWLEEALRRWDLKWNDRQQQNRLTKDTNYDDLDWEAKKQEWMLRLKKCKRNAEIQNMEEQKRFRLILQKTERAVEEAEIRKEKERQEMIERANAKQKAQMNRIRMVSQSQRMRVMHLQMVQEQKDKNAERHRIRHHVQKLAEKMEKQRATWEKHAEFNRQKVAHTRRIEIELENELKMRTQRHKRKVRAEWADIPYAIIRKRLRENRSNELALKYGRIWLKKVRERKKYLPDEEHTSAWTYGHHLQVTVGELREESGHVDLNTFLFSAIRQAVTEQLTLEEQTELEQKLPSERPITRRPGEEADDDDEHDDDYETGNLASGEDSDESDENGKNKYGNSRGGTATDGGYEADEDDQ